MSAELAVLPHDTDAERAVLGAALLSGGTSIDDCTGLRPEDFYRPAHEELWRLLTHLRGKGKPTDTVTVGGIIARDPIRGLSVVDIPVLAGEVPTAANASYYAEIVHDRADLRRVQAALSRGLQAISSGASAETAKATARKILDELDDRDSGGLAHISDALPAVLEQAEHGMGAAQPTPWPELDDRITGLRAGAVYTIGARTSVGKSVVAINIAWQVALAGKRAIIFSLEMSSEDVTRRILSAAARVDYGRLLKGQLHDVEWQRVARANDVLANAPLYIDDRSSITPADIRAVVRDQARKGDLGVVVVDYLQLMSSGRRVENRQQEVSDFSRSLKVLAGDMRVPLVMLSQLNRGVESRQDKHPMLSDLRESGSVEQDSDVVLLLYRDEEQAPDVMEIGVAKNRMGPRTAIRLKWEGHFQRVISDEMGA